MINQLGFPRWFIIGITVYAAVLIGGYPIPPDIPIVNGVSVSSDQITRIPLHGVHNPVFTPLHDAHMVGIAGIVPVKKDNVSRRRLVATFAPLPAILEPGHSLRRTARETWNDTGFNVAALIRTP